MELAEASVGSVHSNAGHHNQCSQSVTRQQALVHHGAHQERIIMMKSKAGVCQ